VTLAAPTPSAFPAGPFRTLETGPPHAQALAQAVRGHDIAVVQTLPSPRQLVAVRRHVPRLVVDLIAPLALELALTGKGGAARRSVVRWRAREMVAHLAAADLVLCTNDRQRDLMVGAGLAAGLFDPDSSPAFQDRVAVVPHGVDPGPRPPRRAVLRDDGFASATDRIAIWGGGIWSWLDPVTAIRAVERLRPSRPDLKLAFVGFEHPDPAQRRAHAPRAAEAMAYVRERALEEVVAFKPRWLSRGEYVEHLQDADVGISLHAATLEGRYASRTRLLDYLTAGLPVVCTGGDTMSELVESHGLGVAVGASDVDSCAEAIDRLTGENARRPDPDEALQPLLWTNVARPLVKFCLGDPTPTGRPRRAYLGFALSSYPAFLRAVYRTESARGLAQGAVRRGASVLGRRP
jgi:glycosyltransferase involved in cell wall biosynthesis